MASPARDDVTALLRAWSEGDLTARDQLVPLVYRELRLRAAARLRRDFQRTPLQPTELVHEAYLRLVDQKRAVWQNRSQFYGLASKMMRRILVDRARAQKTAKRSGQWVRVTLDPAMASTAPALDDVLDIDAALRDLETFDERKSQIVELKFFGGLSLDEIAGTLGLSVATVEREWQAARAWLLKSIGPR
jgi:RNA polymerase sigma factor (TIGR02999 family)